MNSRSKDSPDRYNDILHLPHHTSRVHPPMSMQNRAAQFSPFAALSGYDDAVKETARLTDDKAELSEDALAALSEKMAELQALLPERPGVSVTWFRPDEKKDGGAYEVSQGIIKKIDEYSRTIRFEDGTVIPIDAVSDLELL